jgi:hypothetical protein
MSRYPAIVLIWLASASAAENPDPSSGIAVERIPASYVALGSVVVELNATTLPDLIETVGSGLLRHNGRHAHDGGGDEACFSFRGGVIRFTSDSEMGGSKRTITNALLEESTTSQSECAALPERFASVRVDGWLGIGAGRAAVERHFESSPGRRGTRIRYEFSGHSPGSCQNVDLKAYDVTASLEIVYRGDTVVRIKGSRLTTC